MLNILLIEPNFTYQKVIEKFISKEVIFVKFTSISSFKELKKLNLKKFDIAICDYLLPDSNETEHIDFLLQNKLNAVILTKYNEKIDKKYIDNILEFLNKEDLATFKYLAQLIKRYNKNKNLKVLLVDDSVVSRKKIAKYLKLFNLEVLEATNGEEAKELLKKEDITLIITDIYMPIMDGFELIKFVRQKKSLEELPILGISGVGDSLDAVKLLKFGANDFIKKPFLKEELLIRVANLLNLYDFIHKYKQQSEIDPLTGSYNRTILETKIDTLFHIYEKKSIAMLDIDFFKKINDTYGHQKGDEVLKYFASHIKEIIRKNDFLVRYGGEEFLIFMPNTTKEEAYVVLYKIKNTLKDINGLKFTFSAGIADEGETLAEMIKIADKRLYKAKKEGRNKIVYKD